MVSIDPPVPSSRVEEANWIRERLVSSKPCVTSWIIPSGFEAYARILHPVQLPSAWDRLVRWAEVSRWSGVPMHPLVQWHEIALPRVTPTTEPPWRSQGPREGNLFISDAKALIEDLVRSTSGTESCYLCFWSGYGGGGVTYASPALPLAKPLVRTAVRPMVELPAREYELFKGDLATAASFHMASGLEPQIPNLWWPADRSWCVASEIDLKWTYVGGSRELIERVLADSRIEALPAAPDDQCCLVLEGWLSDLIENATDEVIAKGSSNLELALGTVEIRWQPSRRRGRGQVVTRSVGANGWSGGGASVNTRDSAEFRSQIQFGVARAVIALVQA
jgi:hypothetical protein